MWRRLESWRRAGRRSAPRGGSGRNAEQGETHFDPSTASPWHLFFLSEMRDVCTEYISRNRRWPVYSLCDTKWILLLSRFLWKRWLSRQRLRSPCVTSSLLLDTFFFNEAIKSRDLLLYRICCFCQQENEPTNNIKSDWTSFSLYY